MTDAEVGTVFEIIATRDISHTIPAAWQTSFPERNLPTSKRDEFVHIPRPSVVHDRREKQPRAHLPCRTQARPGDPSSRSVSWTADHRLSIHDVTRDVSRERISCRDSRSPLRLGFARRFGIFRPGIRRDGPQAVLAASASNPGRGGRQRSRDQEGDGPAGVSNVPFTQPLAGKLVVEPPPGVEGGKTVTFWPARERLRIQRRPTKRQQDIQAFEQALGNQGTGFRVTLPEVR